MAQVHSTYPEPFWFPALMGAVLLPQVSCGLKPHNFRIYFKNQTSGLEFLSKFQSWKKKKVTTNNPKAKVLPFFILILHQYQTRNLLNVQKGFILVKEQMTSSNS